MLTISDADRKILWGRSGNRCAFPGCVQELATRVESSSNSKAVVLGEEAHIVAKEDGGPRSNPGMPLRQRDAYQNLILLCPTHHTLVDKDHGAPFSVDDLHAMKAAHEENIGRSALNIRALCLRPIGELNDPFDLEVHPAIDIAGMPHLPVLPAYVKREHDRTLDRLMAEAAEGRSIISVLVGGSSTGKTRACWEAVKGLPDGWQLLHPIYPSHAKAAAEMLDSVGPRTVIWLNEIQRYFITPQIDLGERVAAGLRELLRDPSRGPVVILGTIWPKHWGTIFGDGETSDTGQANLLSQARTLLVGADIRVADAFIGSAVEDLRAAMSSDPRLAEAFKNADSGRIAQYLAGGPALLERYRYAPPSARALIDAAIDCQRLGHTSHFSESLLQAAASCYLTDDQWDSLDDNWFAEALAYVGQPCRGARGLLTRVRPRLDPPNRSRPEYRLADYIEQHGRSESEPALPPGGVWEALSAHAAAEDLEQISDAAAQRGLNQFAARLATLAVKAGLSRASEIVANVLKDAGKVDDAELRLRQSVKTGDPKSILALGRFLKSLGRYEEAEHLFRSAAETGDGEAMRQLAHRLKNSDRQQTATTWMTRSADSGNIMAIRELAEPGWYLQGNQTGEAERRWRQAVELGDSSAIRPLAELLLDAGRIDEAIEFWKRGARAGNTLTIRGLFEWMTQAGLRNEVEQWLICAVQSGDYSRYDLGPAMRTANAYAKRRRRPPRRQGRRGGSTRRVDSKASAGEPTPMLEYLGWYQDPCNRVEADPAFAMRLLAESLNEAGSAGEAERWLRQAAECGDARAMLELVSPLVESGRGEEAFNWLTASANRADLAAATLLVKLHEKTNDTDKLEPFLRRMIETGRVWWASWQLVLLLRKTERHEEAERLQRFGIEPGGRTAEPW